MKKKFTKDELAKIRSVATDTSSPFLTNFRIEQRYDEEVLTAFVGACRAYNTVGKSKRGMNKREKMKLENRLLADDVRTSLLRKVESIARLEDEYCRVDAANRKRHDKIVARKAKLLKFVLDTITANQ